MKYIQLYEQRYRQQILVYHGSDSTDIESFTIGADGSNTDQEGPGIYFTNNLSDALSYGSCVYEVELTPSKLLTASQKAIRSDVEFMVQTAPDVQDHLANWDENPKVAKRMAISAMLDTDNAIETYQSVWYDFYQNHPLEFIKKMPLLRIDGIKIEKIDNVIHYIIYNPACIRILNKI